MKIGRCQNLNTDFEGNKGLLCYCITGRSWQDRFLKEWSDLVRFHTKQEIFQIENDPITMRDWVHEWDHYTRIQLLTKYFSSRKYIFVIEAQKLSIQASNKQEFTVAVRL